MNEAISSFERRLADAGVGYTAVVPLAFEGICVGRSCESGGSAETRRIGEHELFERRDLESGIYSDHATFSVGARLSQALERHPDGARVLELGCGTGLLGILAVRLGCSVTATDVDHAALELARRNAESNGVTLDLREGSLLDPIGDDERFDLVVANLPHKPASVGKGLWEVGGEEGDELFAGLIDGLERVLAPGGGLLFFLHSLPHPRMLAALSSIMDLHLLSWKIRIFEDGEFADARDELRSRHEAGKSFLLESDGTMGMVACVWHAVRREQRP